MENIIFPKLNTNSHLKKLTDYVLVYSDNPSNTAILHPSHALLLGLANGSRSTADLYYLYSEIYTLSLSAAKNIVDALFIQMKRHLSFQKNKTENNEAVAELKSFIYSPNQAVFDQIIATELLPFPTALTIVPSFKCNFNCTYCYQNRGQTQDQLTFDQCSDIIDQAAAYHIIHITLSGGEPTLVDGWIELLAKILQYDMIPIFTTNGFILGKKPYFVKKLRQIGLSQITISLDASYEELHAKITNSTNSFLHVIQAIKSLVESDIKVSIKSVLTKENFSNLSAFIDFAVSLGVKEIGISYKEFGSINSNANAIDNLAEEEIHAAYKIIQEKNMKYRNSCNIYPPKNPYKLLHEKDCVACGAFGAGLVIFPDGNISMCEKMYGMNDFNLGNIYKDSLAASWNGTGRRTLQKHSIDPNMVDNDCSKCTVLKKCKTGCYIDSYNYKGNFFAKQKNCTGPF